MGLKIERVLNNNAVVTIDNAGDEFILVGSGIAFQKKHGGYVSEAKIEKRYKLDGKTNQEHFSKLLDHIPSEYFDVTEQTINLAKTAYNMDLDSSIFVSLTDHIFNAVKREKEGILLNNGLLWEIKQMYPQEFEIGEYVQKSINDRFSTNFDENEAAFIALHILDNKNESADENSVNKTIKIVKEIQHILAFHFKTSVNQESIEYFRLITHLKFFVQRMFESAERSNENQALFQMIQKSYPESTMAVAKVKKYLADQYDYKMSVADQTYLIIHIANIFEKD